MKIIILAMSCDKYDYIKEEELVKEYWAKDIIEGKYKDVSFYFYKSDDNERIEGNYIYVKSGDEYFETFTKTRRCFEFLNENNIEYDYIIRTNCSTYLNVPLLIGLIKKYCSHSFDVFAGEINSGDESFLKNYHTPYKEINFGRGNLLILSKKHINLILEYTDEKIRKIELEQFGINRTLYYTDDAIIGDILEVNDYFIHKLAATNYYEHQFENLNIYRTGKSNGCRFKPSTSCAYVSYKCFNKYIRLEFEEKAIKRIHEFFKNNLITEEDVDKCYMNEY